MAHNTTLKLPKVSQTAIQHKSMVNCIELLCLLVAWLEMNSKVPVFAIREDVLEEQQAQDID